VLTDLAVAPASEWLEFSRLMRSAGCRPIALVPHLPARSSALASSMRIIRWGRASTVRTVKSALRY
jgi:hypothetical protein